MATSRVIRAGAAARRGEAARAEAKERPRTPVPPRGAFKEERGTGSVRTAYSQRQKVFDETDQEVEVLRAKFPADVEPAHVQVGAGLTISLGHYESLRIDCHVRLPCLPSEIEETYEIAAEFVGNRIADEQARWLGTGNGKRRT